MFREWIQKNTNATNMWRQFLHLNGGLAPRLMARRDDGEETKNVKRLIRKTNGDVPGKATDDVVLLGF